MMPFLLSCCFSSYHYIELFICLFSVIFADINIETYIVTLFFYIFFYLYFLFFVFWAFSFLSFLFSICQTYAFSCHRQRERHEPPVKLPFHHSSYTKYRYHDYRETFEVFLHHTHIIWDEMTMKRASFLFFSCCYFIFLPTFSTDMREDESFLFFLFFFISDWDWACLTYIDIWLSTYVAEERKETESAFCAFCFYILVRILHAWGDENMSSNSFLPSCFLYIEKISRLLYWAPETFHDEIYYWQSDASMFKSREQAAAAWAPHRVAPYAAAAAFSFAAATCRFFFTLWAFSSATPHYATTHHHHFTWALSFYICWKHTAGVFAREFSPSFLLWVKSDMH